MGSNPRRFLLVFAATIVVGMGAIAALNVVIDPFRRFDLVTLPGINDQRPVFSSYSRSSKAGVVCRLRPAQVAMGTSRVEVGIDPKHPGWGDISGPVYNLGLSGIGLKELSLMLQHVANTSPLKRAVIGLDFLMFNANREAVVFGTEVLDFDEKQLALSPSDSCWRTLLYNARNLFGDSGLFYSLYTVSHQLGPADESDLSKMGDWEALYDKDGLRSYYPVGAQIQLNILGPRIPFEQEGVYVKRVWRPLPDERYCFTGVGQPNTMDTFRDMARIARRSGVDVRFYLEPVHARMLLALQYAGLWPQFEDWKRAVVKVLAEEAEESGQPQFPLWDFSGFNTITNEHVPDAGDKTMLRWFWEAAHYKKETGDLILDRVLNYHAADRVLPADFGIRLSPENIEWWLVATRMAGQNYVRAEPQEARIVQELVDRALEGSAGSNCGYYMEELRAGSEALRRGDREAASAAFERARAIDQTDRRRASDMGVAYWEPGFATALRTAEAGGALPPNLDTWEAYQHRGVERDGFGDHVGAAEDFARAIRIGPPNPALHYLRGIALLHAKNREAAVAEFEAGLKLDPNNAALRGLVRDYRDDWVAYQDRGIQREAAGDHIGAAEEFAHAIRQAPPNLALHYLRGVALLHADDPQQAAAEFEAGLKLDQTSVTLRGLLQQAQDAIRARAGVPIRSVGEGVPATPR